jgi:signal transduction histidine kinase/ligand-binding sensor domain-containing protein
MAIDMRSVVLDVPRVLIPCKEKHLELSVSTPSKPNSQPGVVNPTTRLDKRKYFLHYIHRICVYCLFRRNRPHYAFMFRRMIFLLIFVLLPASGARALEPTRRLTQALHRIWQVQQGLPDPTIYCLRQFSDGYLWMGTQTGLVRFDGVRFSSIDHAGEVSLSNLWIRDIAEDRKHELWLATVGAGIVHLHDGTATRYGMAEGLPSLTVQQICFDDQGSLWALTAGGVAEWVDGHFVGRPNSSHAPKSFAGGIVAADGSLWLATANGLVHRANGREEVFTTAQGLADDAVLCVAQGSQGTIWAGTKNGFSRVRGNDVDSYRAQDGLSQSTVYSILEDREGTLWVGTKHGLNQFLDGRLIPFTSSEGLASNDAGPVASGGDGTTWIGTLGAGLSRFDGKRFSTLTVKEGLASNRVLSLEGGGGEGGELWVGTDKGVSHIKGGAVDRTYTSGDGLPSEAVRCLFRDHEGTLWAGTEGGGAYLKDGRFVKMESDSRPIVALGEARSWGGGGLLIATAGGDLCLWADGKWIDLAARDPLLRDVDAIYEDDQGLLWMGTSDRGLLMVPDRAVGGRAGGGGKVAVVGVMDGLFDDELFGVMGDAENRLWMACSKGIFSVNRGDLQKFAAGGGGGGGGRLVSTPFSPTDAQRTVECSAGVQPAAARMGDGRLWFSTIHGTIVVDPRHLQRATGPAPAAIEDVVVNGRSEAPGEIGALPPGVKNLEFRYTALSFVAPVRISFRYQLDGFDKEWVDAGARREAFYTNLPPGGYRFLVEAKNVDGAWSASALPVAFSLAPHFYQHWWFVPACVGAAALWGWSIYRRRVRAIQGRLHAIVGERSRIARELHDTLLQGFSGVTMEMQALASRLPASEERGALDEIIRDAGNCMREARLSVSGLRQAGSGGGAAESGLAEAIAQVARQLTETREVKLRLALDRRRCGLKADVEYNLVRIVQEAVANAVKHSGARVIEVTLACTEKEVTVSVADDGAGFDEEAIGQEAGHYGLTGMRERAGQIGGVFELRSEPGRGVMVSVMIGLRVPENRA